MVTFVSNCQLLSDISIVASCTEWWKFVAVPEVRRVLENRFKTMESANRAKRGEEEWQHRQKNQRRRQNNLPPVRLVHATPLLRLSHVVLARPDFMVETYCTENPPSGPNLRLLD